MAKAAFMGLGKMGSGMAGRLVAAGHTVSVWNRTAERAAPLVAAGAIAASSPAEAARDADLVISMVSDDEASARAWQAEDGALKTAPAGALAIECSTLSHGHVATLAADASEKGLAYIDCPVNGPPSAAATGDLILLVGAEADDLDRARPYLKQLATSILHFGPVGTGTAFKLINNLLGAVHVSSLAEAIALANHIGLDKEVFIAATESGPCASPHVKRLVRPMVEGRLSDQFGLSIGLREKDSRYCLAMAGQNHRAMPVGEKAYAWYDEAAKTLGAEDDSALVQLVAKGRETGEG